MNLIHISNKGKIWEAGMENLFMKSGHLYIRVLEMSWKTEWKGKLLWYREFVNLCMWSFPNPHFLWTLKTPTSPPLPCDVRTPKAPVCSWATFSQKFVAQNTDFQNAWKGTCDQLKWKWGTWTIRQVLTVGPSGVSIGWRACDQECDAKCLAAIYLRKSSVIGFHSVTIHPVASFQLPTSVIVGFRKQALLHMVTQCRCYTGTGAVDPKGAC